MEIICVDDSYSSEQLAFWEKHGVSYPKKGSIDTIREICKHTENGTGIKLTNLVNPDVPIKHKILGIVMIEPSWKISRFRTLSNLVITKEMIKEFKEQLTT